MTRRTFYIGHVEQPKPTLLRCIFTAVNTANERMRAAGRREWDDSDQAVAIAVLCKLMRQLPKPYDEIAARLEKDNNVRC